MPLYEYRCERCEQTFEVMQKFSDPPLKKHPNCGGKVQKLLSAPAFHLKGSGWYATDYGRSGSTASKESKSEAKAEAKAEGNGSDSSKSGKSESAGKSEKSGGSSKSESSKSSSESKSKG
jgi:putative FmdB family regulatory protein